MKAIPVRTPAFLRLEIAFREWLSALGYARGTVYYAPLHAREFFAYLEDRGITSPAGVDAEAVETYFHLLATRKNQTRGGGLSRNYLLKHRQVLRLFSRYLVESGQGGFRVSPSVKRRTGRDVAVLTREEIEALYGACQDDALGQRDRAMLALYYGCGLRRSEGILLDLSDVLVDRRLLYVRHGKNYKERYVPLADGVARDLTAYVEEARPALAKPGEKAVLVSMRGGRIDGQSLILRLQALQERAALEVPTLAGKTFGLHALRHSIGTHLMRGGMKLEEIAVFLGHTSLESTQLYTHLAQEEDALERSQGIIHEIEPEDEDTEDYDDESGR